MSRILVTGANGFIGPGLIDALQRQGLNPRASLRREAPLLPGVEYTLTQDIGPDTDWKRALLGVGTVVHLAARGPEYALTGNDAALFWRVNADGTRHLAEAAIKAGVKRFVYLSSVKAAAWTTAPGRKLTLADPALPVDAYGKSKFAGEQALRTLAAQTGLDVAIIRAPLVYGPGVRGNFRTLLAAAFRGRPLPLGRAHNRRSLISRGNLVSAILNLVTHAGPVSGTYYVSDGPAPSLAMLLRDLYAAFGRDAHLWNLPPSLLRAALTLSGRARLADSLLTSLEVDDQEFRARFHWTAPQSWPDGVQETARWYEQEQTA